MSTVDIVTILGGTVAILLGIINFAGIAYVAGVKITRVETEIEHLKDDSKELSDNLKTLSDFLFRRGVAEAVISGSAQMNSPVTVSPKAQELFSKYRNDLRKIAQANPTASDSELGFIIERHMGDIILKHICIPNKMSQGACLLIAVSVAKDKEN